MKALLFLVLFLSIHPTQAKVLIVTLAQVKNHVITSREVEIHQQVEKLLGERFKDIKGETPLEQVIKEWLLFYEAEGFYNTPVQNSEVEKKLNEILAKKKSDSHWQSLAVQNSELKEKVRRSLEADRLYVFKKKASVLPVGIGEVETEYSQNRIRYGNMTFDQVKDQIRDNKIQENLLERMKQWFVVLERKYKVQRFENSVKV